MDFKLFFKEKAIAILLLLFGIITIEIFLMAYNVGMFIKIYIPLIIMGLYMISIIIEYFKRKKFYDNLLKILEECKQEGLQDVYIYLGRTKLYKEVKKYTKKKHKFKQFHRISLENI